MTDPNPFSCTDERLATYKQDRREIQGKVNSQSLLGKTRLVSQIKHDPSVPASLVTSQRSQSQLSYKTSEAPSTNQSQSEFNLNPSCVIPQLKAKRSSSLAKQSASQMYTSEVQKGIYYQQKGMSRAYLHSSLSLNLKNDPSQSMPAMAAKDLSQSTMNISKVNSSFNPRFDENSSRAENFIAQQRKIILTETQASLHNGDAAGLEEQAAEYGRKIVEFENRLQDQRIRIAKERADSERQTNNLMQEQQTINILIQRVDEKLDRQEIATSQQQQPIYKHTKLLECYAEFEEVSIKLANISELGQRAQELMDNREKIKVNLDKFSQTTQAFYAKTADDFAVLRHERLLEYAVNHVNLNRLVRQDDSSSKCIDFSVNRFIAEICDEIGQIGHQIEPPVSYIAQRYRGLDPTDFTRSQLLKPIKNITEVNLAIEDFIPPAGMVIKDEKSKLVINQILENERFLMPTVRVLQETLHAPELLFQSTTECSLTIDALYQKAAAVQDLKNQKVLLANEIITESQSEFELRAETVRLEFELKSKKDHLQALKVRQLDQSGFWKKIDKDVEDRDRHIRALKATNAYRVYEGVEFELLQKEEIKNKAYDYRKFASFNEMKLRIVADQLEFLRAAISETVCAIGIVSEQDKDTVGIETAINMVEAFVNKLWDKRKRIAAREIVSAQSTLRKEASKAARHAKILEIASKPKDGVKAEKMVIYAKFPKSEKILKLNSRSLIPKTATKIQKETAELVLQREEDAKKEDKKGYFDM